MNKKFFRLLALLVCVVLVIGVFSGCVASDKTPKVDNQKTAESSKSKEEGTKTVESTSSKITDKPVILTYWAPLNANVSQTATDYGDTLLYKEVEKRTGVHIQFLHPPVGQEKEQFNLMIASNELPDMIEYNWLSYPGGPEKALEDNVIIKLNDIISKYALNLKKYYSSNEPVSKMVKTDKGNYYCFPFIRGDDFLTVFYGPQLRKDWLKELNLDVPTTIEEWENVLTELKSKKGLDAGITLTKLTEIELGGFIVGAYGVLYGFQRENGQVKFGPMEPRF